MDKSTNRTWFAIDLNWTISRDFNFEIILNLHQMTTFELTNWRSAHEWPMTDCSEYAFSSLSHFSKQISIRHHRHPLHVRKTINFLSSQCTPAQPISNEMNLCFVTRTHMGRSTHVPVCVFRMHVRMWTVKIQTANPNHTSVRRRKEVEIFAMISFKSIKTFLNFGESPISNA